MSLLTILNIWKIAIDAWYRELCDFHILRLNAYAVQTPSAIDNNCVQKSCNPL